MEDFAVRFNYRKVGGGYVIEKFVARNGVEDMSEIFLPQGVADEFVGFYKKHNGATGV